MRIERIELKNFRGHRHTEVDLGAGMTAILGENGSGKTTIPEALIWALYGSRAARGNNDTILFWGAEKGEKVEVKATFVLDGEPYTVARSVKDATVFRDSTPVAEGAGATVEFIEGLLGMSREEFQATYFTGQKELEWLRDKGPADRARFLGKVMGYDKLKDAQKAVRTERNNARSKADAIENLLSSEQPVSEEEITAAKAKLMGALTRAKGLDDALTTANTKAEETKAAMAELTLQRKSWMAARDEFRSAEASKAQADELLVSLKAQREQAAANVDHADYSTKIESTEKDLELTRNEIDVRKERRREAEHAFQLAERQLKDAEQELRVLREQGSGGRCRTCGQVLGDSWQESVRRAEDKVTHLTHQRDTKEEVYKGAQKHFADAPSLTHLETALAELRGKQRASETAKATLQTIDTHIESAAKAADLKTRILEQARADLSTVTFDEERFDQLSMDAARVTETLRSLNADLLDATRTVERLEAKVSSLREALDRRAKLETQRKELTQNLAVLDDTDRLFTELRTALNDRLRPELSEIATQVIAEITDGRFTEFLLDEDYRIRLYDSGREVPVISGGQEDMANLALRIAVSTLVSERSGRPLSFLILDEVFGSLDAGRQEAVIDVLRQLSEDRFEQVILITHTETVKDLADSVILVDRDEKTGASGVTTGFGPREAA